MGAEGDEGDAREGREGCSERRFGFPLSAGRGLFGMTERLADLAGKPVPDVGFRTVAEERCR